MSQPGDSNGWLPWILGAAGIATLSAIIWKAITRIFSYVTRTELLTALAEQKNLFLNALDKQEAKFKEVMDLARADRIQITEDQHTEMLRLHEENKHEAKNNFDRISNRLLLVERSAARLEGKLNKDNQD